MRAPPNLDLAGDYAQYIRETAADKECHIQKKILTNSALLIEEQNRVILNLHKLLAKNDK